MSIKDGILDLPLKKYWFNQIKSCIKIHEYRNAAVWKSKLDGNKKHNYHTIRFRQGQLAKSTDKNKVLYAKILSIKKVNGLDTDLKINYDVYDIEFKLFVACLAIDCIGCPETDCELLKNR